MMEEKCDDGEEDYPYDAWIYSQVYLGVCNSLFVKKVHRSLKNTIQSDALLWKRTNSK